ncbi:SpaH/EbpB family LPXTG-anchored major pilin [Bifidobacterium aerophilum]|uniref:SpaH/EbpB family LPXTG-anchored major pilin n=1 Tax=Bifidobacterium aerophilum TaxID=1798155 RepID=A0A6N9Z6V1_9BIFI|nr:SpaH/EbpB family LPXTG-anchored major pilin [Bifidobacterium aerophilum]NEG90221.1 SpaH/EbpB family LPXTG-anchored major pilin [Bifidobacterium aerophilum]
MNVKKLFAGIAAAATMLGGLALGAATANAAIVTDGDTTITINAENAVRLDGHTDFKAVKLADYDVYGENPNQSATLTTNAAIADKVRDAVNAALAEEVPAGSDPLAWAQQQDEAKFDQSINSPWFGNGTSRSLATQLVASLEAGDYQTVSMTIDANDPKTGTLTMPSPGLWMILDQTAVDTQTDESGNMTKKGSSKALPIIVGTPFAINEGATTEKIYSDGTVEMKNQILTVEKKVGDQTIAIGKDATYTIDTKIPNYVGYKVKGYTFTVSDQFEKSAPLAYKAGSLVVKVGDVTLDDDQYTVTGFDANSKTFTVDLSEYIKSIGLKEKIKVSDDTVFDNDKLVGQGVTITYAATVTGTISEQGAANRPFVEYPHNPSSNEDKDKIPGVPVKVFNFDYTLKKTDKVTGDVLKGAKFTIQNTETKKYLAYGYDQGKQSMSWSDLDVQPSGGEGQDETVGVFTTGDDGLIAFKGLDEGSYKIEEIAAPEGHANIGLSFTVKIEANITGEGNEAVAAPTYTVSGDTWGLVSDGNSAEVTVRNIKSITELPLTGAAGTMLFTLVGLLLAGGAATVYLRSRSAKRALMR